MNIFRRYSRLVIFLPAKCVKSLFITFQRQETDSFHSRETYLQALFSQYVSDSEKSIIDVKPFADTFVSNYK